MIESFAQDGFCVLPGALSIEEVTGLNEAIGDHQLQFPDGWPDRGEGGRRQCVSILLNMPVFDHGLLHPEILPLVSRLVGKELVVEEHSVMVRAPIAGNPPVSKWHRDRPNNPDHEFGLEALSLVYYLTDVDETTHCFSVVPETVETKRGENLPGCDGSSARDVLGPAGTALLFNAGSCHAGRLRTTTSERRTIHIYFGHASHAPLSNHTPMPRRLVEHPDEDVRRLFSQPNEVTRSSLCPTVP